MNDDYLLHRLKPHDFFIAHLKKKIDEDFNGSQNAAAKSYGIAQKTLWSWCNGQRPPKLNSIEELCIKNQWDFYDVIGARRKTTAEILGDLDEH